MPARKIAAKVVANRRGDSNEVICGKADSLGFIGRAAAEAYHRRCVGKVGLPRFDGDRSEPNGEIVKGAARDAGARTGVAECSEPLRLVEIRWERDDRDFRLDQCDEKNCRACRMIDVQSDRTSAQSRSFELANRVLDG